MAYINGNEILFSANVDISGASPELEGRVNALEASVGTLEKEVDFLKLVNEGHTYKFSTETETASVRAIPLKTLPYAVLEKVGGRTTNFAEIVEGGASLPFLAYRQLNAITIYGKNLMPNTVNTLANWVDLKTLGQTDKPRWAFPFALPKYGKYTVSIKRTELADHYLGIQISTDGGTSWEQVTGTYFLDKTKNNSVTFDYTKGMLCRFYYADSTSTPANNLKLLAFQIEYGETATAYTPYAVTFEYTIPQDIKNLAGYGHGISNTVCNYIDFENKQYVQMCEVRAYEPSDDDRSDVVCSGGGILTCAPLATPNVTNVANYLQGLDNTIAVQGGGLICFEYNLISTGEETITETIGEDVAAAPSTITYQLKL